MSFASIARLGFEVDRGPLRAASRELGRLGQAAQGAASHVGALDSVFGRLADGLASGDLSSAFDRLWADFEARGREALSSVLKAVGSGSQSLLGAFSSLPIVGKIAAAAALVKGLIGGKTQIGAGLAGTIAGENSSGGNFRVVQTRRLFGLYKRTRTYFSQSAAFTERLATAAGQMQGSVLDMAATLNATAGDLGGVALGFRIDTKGKSAAQIEAELAAQFDAYGDKLAAQIKGLGQFLKAGEGAFDGLARLTTAFSTVNAAFDALGFTLYDASLAGGAAADAFADLFGGLEGFSKATSAYFEAFYTDQERLDMATKALGSNLAELGLDVVPTTGAAFRALVDQAMASGNEALAASLIQLAPQMANVLDQSQRLTAGLSAGAKDFETLADERLARALLTEPAQAADGQTIRLDELIGEVKALRNVTQAAFDEQLTEAV